VADDSPTRTLVIQHGDSVEVRFPAARLLVEAGPDDGLEVELGNRAWVLGRGSDADVVLEDQAVSRAHARLEPCDQGWRLVDLESRGGTFVDEVRIEQAVLSPANRIRMGTTELVLRCDEAALRAEPAEVFSGLLSRSPQMQRLFGMLEKVAATDLPVLLIGESGTGKEGLARAVHEASDRAGKAYEVVDCTLLTGEHLRSELFGHSKGAFTGATSDHPGAFVRADGGTLFLDEVGEVPLELQPALLRALESGEVRALGGATAERVDVRALAATHRDLPSMVEAGTFRRDLYHRLAVLDVPVPPLRDREGDVAFLAEHFLPEGAALEASALAALEAYTWPGNVRELKNAMLRAGTLCQGGRVKPDDLRLGGGKATPSASPRSVDEWTEHAIRDAMERFEGSRKDVCAELGISRSTLYRRLKEMAWEDDR
jgi:DNA-binding NtrC family response regulator